MTDVREILRRALPETAPPPVTRESAVAAGRRAARRRRTRFGAVAVAAAVAAVLGGTGLVAGTGGGGSGVGANGTPSPSASSSESEGSATPSPVASATPTITGTAAAAAAHPPVRRRLTEPRAAAAARLTSELRASVRAELPGATFRQVTIEWVGGRRIHPPLEVQWLDSAFMAFTDVVDAAGTGTMEFHAGPYMGENPKRRFARYCDIALPPSISSCETRVGPHGELITIETGYVTDTSPIQEYRVDVARADGTGLVLVARNLAAAGDPNAGRPQRPTPPFTVDQMVAVLLAPGLTVYP